MHYPDLGSDASSIWNFCARFSDVIWRPGKPEVASPNVGCFIRLIEPQTVEVGELEPSFKNLTENNVKSVSRGLSFNKAPGYNKVLARILKESFPIAALVIVGLINNSFQLSTVPVAWKLVEIVPMPKEGDPGYQLTIDQFHYRVFSHDVTAAILVSQNNETAAMLVSQTNPLGVELFSYANDFFCSNKFA